MSHKEIMQALTDKLTLENRVSFNGYEVRWQDNYWVIIHPNGTQIDSFLGNYPARFVVAHLYRHYSKPDKVVQQDIDDITHY